MKLGKSCGRAFSLYFKEHVDRGFTGLEKCCLYLIWRFRINIFYIYIMYYILTQIPPIPEMRLRDGHHQTAAQGSLICFQVQRTLSLASLQLSHLYNYPASWQKM